MEGNTAAAARGGDGGRGCCVEGCVWLGLVAGNKYVHSLAG